MTEVGKEIRRMLKICVEIAVVNMMVITMKIMTMTLTIDLKHSVTVVLPTRFLRCYAKNMQEILGRTNLLLSFDKTRTA
jgi:hypothetical protein